MNDSLFVTIDGMHRVRAARGLNEKTINAIVGEVLEETFQERLEAFKE